MGRTRQAVAGFGWGSGKSGSKARLVVVAASLGMPMGMAQAAPGVDCNAVNRGALSVDLGSETTATRQVALEAGEKLTFRFEAATSGPFGSVTLRQGATARSLLVGPTGTRVSFIAPRKGAFDFELAKEGTEAAAFTVSCVSAADARRSSAAMSAARRSAKLLGGAALATAASLETGDLAGIVLDAGVPASSRGRANPSADNQRPRASAELPAPSFPLDMKMEWAGERYRPAGPEGLEPDHSASGVKAALNYKLLPDIMIGALAQIDQPGETFIGAPFSLLDQGWMVGPVAKVKLAHGLSLDARAAWGVAETAADELAARAISSSRRMISAKLANTQSFGAWRFSPSVSLNHLQEAGAVPAAETQDPAMPGGTSFGRVDVGPEIAYRIDLEKSAFIEPRAVIGSFWDIDSLSSLAPGGSHGDMRLKAEAGVTIGVTDGAKMQASGGVEEGAEGAADVWSGRVQFSVPMK